MTLTKDKKAIHNVEVYTYNFNSKAQEMV